MANRTNPARKINESAPSAARDPHQKAHLDKQDLPRFQPAFDLDAQAVIDAILTIEPELFRELVTTARIEPRYIAYAILQCGFDAKEFEALLDDGSDPDYSPRATLASFLIDFDKPYRADLGFIRPTKFPMAHQRTKPANHLVPPFARMTRQ